MSEKLNNPNSYDDQILNGVILIVSLIAHNHRNHNVLIVIFSTSSLSLMGVSGAMVNRDCHLPINWTEKFQVLSVKNRKVYLVFLINSFVACLISVDLYASAWGDSSFTRNCSQYSITLTSIARIRLRHASDFFYGFKIIPKNRSINLVFIVWFEK